MSKNKTEKLDPTVTPAGIQDSTRLIPLLCFLSSSIKADTKCHMGSGHKDLLVAV